jgi:peptide-methionine (S)-S-oxide reductase
MLSAKIALAALAVAAAAWGLARFGGPSETPQMTTPQDTRPSAPVPEGAQTLVVAGGCFWCVEAIFEDLKGVHSVESGYAGGSAENPTYQMVLTGSTGHAEAVKIVFDPKTVGADDLLRIFFTTHDPTTLNRQGNDVGTQYRSAVFFANEDEKALARRIIDEITAEKVFDRPIVTTLEPLTAFYPAEDYHQDYFEKFERATPEERAKMNAGYCSAVIAPKVAKFRAKYADRLRK